MNAFKSFFSKYFGLEVNYKIRTFRIILLFGAVAVLFGIAFNAVALQTFTSIITSLIIDILLILTLYISIKLKDPENLFFIALLIVNCVFCPIIFFQNGGIESAVPLWFLLGFVMLFFFLEGWKLYFSLTSTTISVCAVYIIALLKPELITTLNSEDSTLASCIGVLIVSCFLGAVFAVQKKAYNSEKKLSEQRNQKIQEMSDSKSLFFANMSHEIRTPINTIIGLNEMILRENISDEIAENAINIQNASKILLALINDILDLSKIESGKMEIIPAQYETSSLFSEVVNIIWIRANQKGLDFRIDIAEDIPSMLYGDEVRIKQILTNILTNAIKYTEKGSVILTVSSEQTDENTVRLKIAVEDTDIGIKKESLDNLFDVFKRVDSQKTKNIEGTGLGLAITKQLVDMMGGTIKVDSIYQKGTCFTVTIDQKIIDRNPLGSMQYAAKRGASNREQYNRTFEAPNAKILVVDDNEMNLMVAKKLLRDTKVQVELASSGKECLEKTEKNNYHVIFMDHKMPEMDGEETLKLLRSRQEGFCQTAPVIALTANVMPNAMQWYQERGFDSYLAKPISGKLLEANLLKFLPSELIEYIAESEENSLAPEYSAMTFHRRKKRIAVCTECTCDLPDELIEEHDIKLMYYYIKTDNGRFIDTKEIGTAELLEYISKGNVAISTPAPLDEYESFFADRLTEAEQVLFITIGSGVGKGYDNALLGATKNFDNVTVFDSGHLSSGMGLIVLKAAQMAESGAQMDEIMGELIKMKDKVSTSFILQSVDNMYQNKKIGKKIYTASKALQLRPVLRISQNRLVVSGVKFGLGDRAAKSYIRQRLRHKRLIDKEILFITYAGLSMKQLEDIKKEVLKYVKFETIKFQKASATVSSNCGVGTFGLLYMRK